MPTYEYICRACGHEFEEFHSIKADPIAICPKCRKKKVERKIGIGGAVIFKGGGFYETDYRSESYRSGEDAEKKSRDVKPESKSEGKSDAKSETTPDAAKANASKTADVKPGPGKPESAKTEASKTEASKTEASKSETPKADAAKPDSKSAASAENKRIEDRATHRSRIGRGVGNIVKKPAPKNPAAKKPAPKRK